MEDIISYKIDKPNGLMGEYRLGDDVIDNKTNTLKEELKYDLFKSKKVC